MAKKDVSKHPEKEKVAELFAALCRQPKLRFPKEREQLIAPTEAGVYVIRQDNLVLHVGRTLRGKDGLHQRLKNHLRGSSSFTDKYLKGKGALLRDGRHTHQSLVVENTRLRALLEAYAIGTLCPKHIGLGE